MFRVRTLLILISSLSLLSVLPLKTNYAEEIPFRVKTDLTALLFISCKGPFGRNSGCIHVDTQKPDFELFYSAEINFFSPYGEWSCAVYALPICFGVAGGKIFQIHRHPVPDSRVDLTIVECDGCFNVSYRILVETEHTCCGISTSAFLGDRPEQKKPDKDTFSFEATEHDEILLSLVEDGAVGHIGEEANFKFRGPIGSATINEISSGTLPLDIEIEIPETGVYEIEVDQKGIPIDISYRGGYIIELTSSLNDVDEIVPSRDVE